MKRLLILATIALFVSSCGQKESQTSAEQVDYIESGKEIAQGTFVALSTTLKQTIHNKGIEEAVAYCKVNAIPITDSMAIYYNAEIRRTSIDFRNPKNAPDSTEMKVLVDFANAKLNGEKLGPITIEDESQARFFAPISAQALCLNCHGVPGVQIADATYEMILNNYPEDLAIGYDEGDLRGMWSITFKK